MNPAEEQERLPAVVEGARAAEAAGGECHVSSPRGLPPARHTPSPWARGPEEEEEGLPAVVVAVAGEATTIPPLGLGCRAGSSKSRWCARRQLGTREEEGHSPEHIRGHAMPRRAEEEEGGMASPETMTSDRSVCRRRPGRRPGRWMRALDAGIGGTMDPKSPERRAAERTSPLPTLVGWRMARLRKKR